MARKAKKVAKAKSRAKKVDSRTAALNAHTKALIEHSAALIAAKPKKSPSQKRTDTQLCMSEWLMRKGISQADSLDPTKNMATDFRVAGKEEMSRALNSVRTCLLGKGDIYTPTDDDAKQLWTKLLGEVVHSIASKIR
jgi:hypothetical protein